MPQPVGRQARLCSQASRTEQSDAGYPLSGCILNFRFWPNAVGRWSVIASASGLLNRNMHLAAPQWSRKSFAPIPTPAGFPSIGNLMVETYIAHEPPPKKQDYGNAVIVDCY